ncbi:hypothetical protein GCM10010406_18100 [Streptomyces thermolineatus]|uniref:Uncharacterized protein n=1 Tax=Streptomyces thermolineatus TaxID=44033 RepID=A0ABP5YMK0_9ACTN
MLSVAAWDVSVLVAAEAWEATAGEIASAPASSAGPNALSRRLLLGVRRSADMGAVPFIERVGTMGRTAHPHAFHVSWWD